MIQMETIGTGKERASAGVLFSALAFLLHFKLSLLGRIAPSSCFKETPLCHIAMAPYFLNYIYQHPALLVFLLLASFAYLLPVYCLWLCPFKMTGFFMDAEAVPHRLQYALMLAAPAALRDILQFIKR